MDNEKYKIELKKLLGIDKEWLIDYIAEMLAYDSFDFIYALGSQNREDLESIIEKYIYS